jgi:3-isopropylmalate dehydrogenase
VKARIGVLAGDGVGREIVPEAVKVLKVVAQTCGHVFEFTHGDIGGQALDKVGVPLPQDTLSLAKQSDAVLLGAVGGPKWEGLEYSLRPERALLGIREALGLYANLRPAKLYPNLAEASTLKKDVVEGIDILVVRELTGGIYFGKPKGIEKLPNGSERGVNTEVYTTEEIRRGCLRSRT